MQRLLALAVHVCVFTSPIVNKPNFNPRFHVQSDSNKVAFTFFFLNYLQEDGSPTRVDVNRNFLGVVTSCNCVRVYKLGGREAKPCCPAQLLQVAGSDEAPEEVLSIRINCTGSMVCRMISSRATFIKQRWHTLLRNTTDRIPP